MAVFFFIYEKNPQQKIDSKTQQRSDTSQKMLN